MPVRSDDGLGLELPSGGGLLVGDGHGADLAGSLGADGEGGAGVVHAVVSAS